MKLGVLGSESHFLSSRDLMSFYCPVSCCFQSMGGDCCSEGFGALQSCDAPLQWASFQTFKALHYTYL